jgi:branched-chain amino acid transport system substrate-binding protein
MEAPAKRYRTWIALVAVLLLTSSACGTDAADPGDGEAPGEMISATIASVLPVSGPAASLGQQQADAVKLAVDDLREGGTVDFTLIEEDAGESNTTALNALRRVSGREPHVIAAPIFGTMILALDPELQELGIPTVTTSGSRAVTQQGNQWMFRFFPHDGIAKVAQAQFAVENLGARQPAILHGADEYGHSGRDFLVEGLAQVGIEPAAIQSMDNDDTDISGQIRRIRDSGADAVLVQAAPPHTNAMALRNIRRAGLDLPLVWGSGMTSPTVLDLVTEDEVDGVYAETAGLIEGSGVPAIDDFAERYTDRFGTPPDIFALLMYDAVTMAGTAIAEAGSTDPEDIYRQMSIMEYVGLSGTYRSDEEGTMIQRSVIVVIDETKALVVVDEFEVEFTPREL